MTNQVSYHKVFLKQPVRPKGSQGGAVINRNRFLNPELTVSYDAWLCWSGEVYIPDSRGEYSVDYITNPRDDSTNSLSQHASGPATGHNLLAIRTQAQLGATAAKVESLEPDCNTKDVSVQSTDSNPPLPSHQSLHLWSLLTYSYIERFFGTKVYKYV